MGASDCDALKRQYVSMGSSGTNEDVFMPLFSLTTAYTEGNRNMQAARGLQPPAPHLWHS